MSRPEGLGCLAGHFCLPNSSMPQPCPAGSFQPLRGQANCELCPAGYVCSEAGTVEPPVCPIGRFCPRGSGLETQPCPPGTYGNETGLDRADQCSPCPRGSWCLDGALRGPCAPGFLCAEASATPTPPHSVCPAGFWCPEGALEPVSCAEGTIVRHLETDPSEERPCNSSGPALGLGGTSPDDCLPCPAGFLCRNSSLHPCPAGAYCEDGASTPCPAGSYGPSAGLGARADCQPCPAGFLCVQPGTHRLDGLECAPGFFCPAGAAAAEPCPAGLFRNATGGKSLSDCAACPFGKVCTEPGLSTPSECPAGRVCRGGSSSACPPGFYCPAGSSEPVSCPRNFYCPPGSDSPLLCPAAHFCAAPVEAGTSERARRLAPAGASVAAICPLGYRDSGLGDRFSLETACTRCEAGKYGSDPLRRVCFDCEPGFVCLEGAAYGNPDIFTQPRNQSVNLNFSTPTTNGVPLNDVPYTGTGENGTANGFPSTLSFPCPPGHYCPRQSPRPTPCPAGTFNAEQQSSAAAACQPCAANTFAAEPGQARCVACGASSRAAPGSSTCRCIGRNRAFNPESLSCTCLPRYSLRDFLDDDRHSFADGTQDCQPQVFERCERDEYRSEDGECRTASEWLSHCRGACPLGAVATPWFDPALGRCLCQPADNLEAACPASCRAAEQARHLVRCGVPAPTLEVTDPASGAVLLETATRALGGREDVGLAACEGRNLDTVSAFFMRGGPLGYSGVYAPNATTHAEFLSAALLVNRSASASPAGGPVRRAFGDAEGVEVLNPVTCLELGQVVLFTVTPEQFLGFDKDNLLNRQADAAAAFDETPLVDLRNQAPLLPTLAIYAHAFTAPGVWVLRDQLSGSRLVFAVMRNSTRCPATGPFFPATATYFYLFGVQQESNLVVEADWAMIAYLTLGGLGFVLLSLLLLWACTRTRSPAAASPAPAPADPAYRLAAKDGSLDHLASKSTKVLRGDRTKTKTNN
jgi:hypothetical protein